MAGLNNPTEKAVAIAASATKSGVIDLGGEVLCGITFPAAMTGTSVSFERGWGGTYSPIYDTDGLLVTVTIVASAYINLFPSSFMGVNQIKVVSNGTEATPRAFTLTTRAID